MMIQAELIAICPELRADTRPERGKVVEKMRRRPFRKKEDSCRFLEKIEKVMIQADLVSVFSHQT